MAQSLKDDKRAIFTAASHAQKAADCSGAADADTASAEDLQGGSLHDRGRGRAGQPLPFHHRRLQYPPLSATKSCKNLPSFSDALAAQARDRRLPVVPAACVACALINTYDVRKGCQRKKPDTYYDDLTEELQAEINADETLRPPTT
jgi:hypothetical protein